MRSVDVPSLLGVYGLRSDHIVSNLIFQICKFNFTISNKRSRFCSITTFIIEIFVCKTVAICGVSSLIDVSDVRRFLGPQFSVIDRFDFSILGLCWRIFI